MESTGASKANIQMLDAGECNLALVQNDVMYYAYTGTDLFSGEDPITSFSAVCSFYPEYVQIIASSDITSIDQLAGKNVSVGDAGSGCEFNAKQILEAYGLTFDDINVSNQSFADSADSLRNGTIDAAFVVAGYPTTAVTELATNYDFNLLPIDADHAAALQAQYGFYYYGNIPGGTYTCVADDVPAVAVMATIVASNDLSEDVIYAFVKGLFDYKADISASPRQGRGAGSGYRGLRREHPLAPGRGEVLRRAGIYPGLSSCLETVLEESACGNRGGPGSRRGYYRTMADC